MCAKEGMVREGGGEEDGGGRREERRMEGRERERGLMGEREGTGDRGDNVNT